jgi:hypothetical protein
MEAEATQLNIIHTETRNRHLRSLVGDHDCLSSGASQAVYGFSFAVPCSFVWSAKSAEALLRFIRCQRSEEIDAGPRLHLHMSRVAQFWYI